MSLLSLFKKKEFIYTIYINRLVSNECAQSIEKAFNSLGNSSAKADLHKKCVYVYSKNEFSENTIKELVENTGFEFVKIKKQ